MKRGQMNTDRLDSHIDRNLLASHNLSIFTLNQFYVNLIHISAIFRPFYFVAYFQEKSVYKINSGAKSEARLPAVYRAHHNARILCVMEHPTLKIRQNASLLLDVQCKWNELFAIFHLLSLASRSSSLSLSSSVIVLWFVCIYSIYLVSLFPVNKTFNLSTSIQIRRPLPSLEHRVLVILYVKVLKFR